MLSLFKSVLDPAFRKPYINVTRWFTTVINQPNVKAVLGDVVLCSKMAEFDSKKWAEFSGKGKKEDKKEEDAPADMPPIEKRKDPLDELPSGTKFNLEEWKRFYSNNDEDDSIKWFWEHFDAENYSIWRAA